MKREMYKVSKEELAVKHIERLYENMLSESFDSEERRKLVKEILSLQAEDGFFIATDYRKVDSDYLVDYIYRPTYLATAALMYADLMDSFSEDSQEKTVLLNTLLLAAGRGLMGHGYEATESLIDSLNIYKKAGVYEWIQTNEKEAPEFCQMIHAIIEEFKERLESGHTVSDWNRDFRVEFQKEVEDYENSSGKYVWYAAYGSNINKTRFMAYINNCSDRTAPLEDRPYTFAHNIYFASESRLWERKGTAFLDDSKAGMAYGRVYRISKAQFIDVKQQEGSKYSKQVLLGEIDGLPVYTFTAPTPYKIHKEPSQAYMQVIREGLKEVYPEMSESFINTYLYTRDILNADDVAVLSFVRHSAHGVSIETMTQTGVPVSRVKEAIKRLCDLGLLKQDSRSVAAGHNALDRGAVYFTRKEKRELVDVMLLFVNRY